MKKIRVCYLTLGVENSHGANSTNEFIRIARDHDMLQANVITTGKDVFFGGIFSLKGAKSIIDCDLVHYVPRIRHIFYHPLLLFLALASRKLILDLRSVNIHTGFRFYIQCFYIQFLARFSRHVCGNLGAPRSYGLSCRYTNIPIGIDSLWSRDSNNTGEMPGYAIGKINLLYVASFNKSRRFEEFLRVFYANSDHSRMKLHVIGDAPTDLIRSYPGVNFLGRRDRKFIFSILKKYDFVALCFMAAENHDLAPAIKLLEYSYFNQRVLVSKTAGLLAQAQQIGLSGQVFVDNFDGVLWSNLSLGLLPEPVSFTQILTYEEIFDHVVLPMYRRIKDCR